MSALLLSQPGPWLLILLGAYLAHLFFSRLFHSSLPRPVRMLGAAGLFPATVLHEGAHGLAFAACFGHRPTLGFAPCFNKASLGHIELPGRYLITYRMALVLSAPLLLRMTAIGLAIAGLPFSPPAVGLWAEPILMAMLVTASVLSASDYRLRTHAWKLSHLSRRLARENLKNSFNPNSGASHVSP